jgi:hypothetical protein
VTCFKEHVRYRSSVSYVWEYLDWAYMRQDTFLHDLMKLVHAVKGIREKNYRGLEVYLGLLLRIFDIAEDSGMLPILHQNNLRPMYEKWLHGDQARWWTHAEKADILDQSEEFCRYIRGRYYLINMLASQVAISSNNTKKGNSCQPDDGQKPKDG